MKQPRTINVLLVAGVSAILHGAVAVVFIPTLAMLLLSLGALPAPFHAVITAEHGMVFAVAAPLVYAALGFGFGALMAFLYNMFARTLAGTRPQVRVVIEPALEVESATVSDAA